MSPIVISTSAIPIVNMFMVYSATRKCKLPFLSCGALTAGTDDYILSLDSFIDAPMSIIAFTAFIDL